MGKRDSRRRRTTSTPPPGSRAIPRRVFLAAGGLLAATAALLGFQKWGEPVKGPLVSDLVRGGDLPRRGEMRPTLPPDRFQGKVRRAYQVAREIPELLDKLYCYCFCDRTFDHKSLLSCYASTHAAA